HSFISPRHRNRPRVDHGDGARGHGDQRLEKRRMFRFLCEMYELEVREEGLMTCCESRAAKEIFRDLTLNHLWDGLNTAKLPTHTINISLRRLRSSSRRSAWKMTKTHTSQSTTGQHTPRR